jgi:release factor glutamine methyltransferase
MAGTDRMSVLQRVIEARERLRRAGIPPDQAAIDAEILARHALGQDRATYLAHRDESIADDASERLEAMVRRREGREPVAYILGEREFWGLSFLVSPAVLIPRPETEAIVEKALARMDDVRRPWRIADVGTGSGCLAVALARERVNAKVIATDISEAALGVAAANAVRHGVDSRIRLVRTSLLDDVPGPFDLIVANPPYVPGSTRDGLQPDVRDHEPETAVFGHGADGLDEVRHLLTQTPEKLTAGGWLLMEFGFGQGDAVRAAVSAVPDLEFVELLHDLQGLERTLVARASGSDAVKRVTGSDAVKKSFGP